MMTFNVFTQHLVSVDLDRKSSGCILLIAIIESPWSTTWDVFCAKCRFTASLAISPTWGITSRWDFVLTFFFSFVQVFDYFSFAGGARDGALRGGVDVALVLHQQGGARHHHQDPYFQVCQYACLLDDICNNLHIGWTSLWGTGR